MSEDVIITSSHARSSFTFVVSGAQVASDGHGLRFSGTIGKAFSIAAPAVFLASGKDATALSQVKYTPGAGGRVTVSVDRHWLASLPSRDFPLRIDPDIYPAPSNFESCTASSCVVGVPGGAPSGSDVQLGFDGTNTWGAAMVFSSFDSYLNQGLSVYQAGIGLNAFVAGTQIYNSCYGVTPPCPTTQLNLYLQGSAQPSTLGQIGQGSGPCASSQPVATMFDPPTPGPNISADLTGVMQCIFANNLSSQWWGLTASGVSGGSNPLRYYNMFLSANLHPKPAPSRVTSMQDGEVIASTTPTLQASPILLTQQEAADNDLPDYQYQVTTGPAPNAGLVVSSGFMEDVNPCTVGQSGCTDVPPNWQVPAGALQEGVTYHAWVLTDWDDNADRYLGEGVPAVQPPSDWGVNFTVRLGLGQGGPSPTDQVGSVPGQSDTPSAGAPSPGLPGSKLSVNMVDGNASLTIGTPSLASVGGGLSLGFTYNSLSVGAGDTLSGLQGSFYNTVGGSSVLVGQRVDPTVEFNLPASQGLTAVQNPQAASATWSGVLSMPVGQRITSGDQVEIGEISSDGMIVNLGSSAYITDPGPHSAQAAPTWGAPIVDTGQSMTINVQLTHTSANPIVAELYLQDLTNPGVFSFSPGWLTHSPGVLPAGWTLNSNASQATWVGLADHGSSVTVYSSDGTGFEFANAGGGIYSPPVQVPNARLHVDTSGNFVLDDPDGGLIYTFNPNGQLSGVRSSSDDLNPAALSYAYATTFLNTTTATPAPLLRTISDPVDPADHTTTLIYSGDLAPGGGSDCPSVQYFYAAPTGLLCQIKLWNGTTTNLYYNSSGEFARVDDPGPVTYAFAYDSNGRLIYEEDPLAYSVIYGPQGDLRASDCPGYFPAGCLTTISYDTNNRVSTVISPAPNSGGTVANGGQPEHGYCYGSAKAVFSANYSISNITYGGGTTTVTSGIPVSVGETVTISGVQGLVGLNAGWAVTAVGSGTFQMQASPSGTYTPGTGSVNALACSDAAANVSSVAVAGLSPSVGYTEQVRFDNRERITSTHDSAGSVTSYVWDSHDRLISTTTPAGIETSSAYDTQGHVTDSYGPAPSSSFNPDGSPVSGQSVAASTNVYDGGMSGLAGAWYANTSLAGTPVYHSLAGPSESWAGGVSPSSGSSEPNLVPSSGFSGDLTGLVSVPSAGRLSFDGDGGRVQIDGHPYIDQMGGPYPAQARQDAPSDWWRLGEAPGTGVAADSAGTDPGTYSGGVTLGQVGPFADQDSTAAAFNGTSGSVSIPDSTNLELSNTEPFSMEAWVKIPSTGFIQPIASKLTSNAALTGWEFGIYDGDVYLLLVNSWSSNAIDVTTAQTLSINAWHLVTVTYDGSSKAAGVTFYVDGTAVAKATPLVDTLSASAASSAPLTLGERPPGPYYLTGDLADVSVYPNTILNAARVAARHSAAAQTSTVTQGPVIYDSAYPEAVDAEGPVSYWRLGDPSGGATATDSFGANSGTYSNVTLGQAGPLVGDGSTSAGFNGTNSTVSVADTPDLEVSNDQAFSVEAWVKTTGTGTQDIVSKMTNAAPYRGWEFGVQAGRPYLYLINTWSSNAVYDLANADVSDGAWHHLVVSYDGSSKAAGVTFYVDGMAVSDTISDDTLTATAISTAGVDIGSRAGNTNFFDGDISDVSFCRQALDATTVAAHYQAGALAAYPKAVEADQPADFWRLAGGQPAIAAGTSPAVVSMGNGQIAIAYQAAGSDDLAIWQGTPGGTGATSDTGFQLGWGTSPSIDSLGNGEVAVAFSASGGGGLWTWAGTPGTTGTAGPAYLGVTPGTSPSIASLGNGQVGVAFSASGGGGLWTWSGTPGTTGYGAPTDLGITAGTSASIASLGNGQVAVAFSASGGGGLWTWSGTPGTTGYGTPTDLGITAGTSPSIASLGNGQAGVAFSASGGGGLWTWSGTPGTTGYGTPTDLGITAGTSPSIASLGSGQAAVAFEASGNSALWTWSGAPGTTGYGNPTVMYVNPGTNPDLISLGGGQIAVALENSGTNALWTWQGVPASSGTATGTVVGTASDISGFDTGTYLGGVGLGQAGPLAGNPDSSVGFNGTNATVAASDNPGLQFSNTQAFSVEAWVKTSSTAQQVILSKMANASPYQGWELGLVSGKPYFLLASTWSTNAIQVNATASLSDGKWHHLVVTYDGSSKAAGVTFYVDGVAQTGSIILDSLTGNTQSDASPFIGSRAGSVFFFNGNLADVAVYLSALTQGQIALHHQAGTTPPGPAAGATTHTITVEDQQFVTNGHLNLTSTASGTTFDPDYGLVTQTTDADGKTTNTNYTDSAHGIGPQFGLATAVTQDPNGLKLTTTTTYETPGTGTYLRVMSKALPAGSGSTYTYYANTAGPVAAVCGVGSTTSQAGALEQRTDPAPTTGAGDALVEQYVYDTTGRQVGLRKGTVNTINSAGWQCTNYDPEGRISSQTYPAFGSAFARTVTYAYAVGGNPLVNSVTDTNWGNSSISSTVDLLDRVTSYTDIWANTTTTTYDQAGRATASSGPQGALTYNFDPATARPTSTVDGGLAIGTDAYDNYGRLNTVYVDGTTHGGEVLYYDTNGRLYARTNYTTNVASGEIVTFSPAGRVVDQQVYDNGSMVDANPNGPNYTYDGAGRLTQAILPGATYSYGYAATSSCPQNNAGEDTNRTSLTVNSTATGYCYDNADRLTSTSVIPSGQVVYDGHGNMIQEGTESFAYDSADQLNLDDAPTYLDLYTRDPLGRPAQISNYTKITAGNTTTATATAASAISINRPSGTVAGDELIASITTSSQQNFSAPSGWTYVDGAQSGLSTTWVFAHPATSTDPSSWSFGVNVLSANIVGSIVDYLNPNPTTPLDAYNAAAIASSTSQPLPAVTTHGYAETLVHVVGYSLLVTPTAPAGDTQRASASELTVTQLVSDRYQQQPGQSASASASSNLATTSDAITVALEPAVSTSRLGYTGQTDVSGFTQTIAGTTIGTNVALSDGMTYETTPSGAGWVYTNLHGDTIDIANSTNTTTWTGYWGPYGENASGSTPPSDTSIPGGSYGYNGAQGKLSEGNLVLMGTRPYSPTDGRFTQVDPIQGGCANDYTYAFGDPLNNPDLSGQDATQASGAGGPVCSAPKKHHHHWWDSALNVGLVVTGVVVVVGATIATAGIAGAVLATGEFAATESAGWAAFTTADLVSHAVLILAPTAGAVVAGGVLVGIGVTNGAGTYALATSKACGSR